ncbi:unnamed protein product, partial [Medioppia subpectinata]
MVILNDRKSDISAEGVFGDFLHYMLTKINISYTIVRPKDNQWGVHEKGKWTGLYGMIYNNESDMILGPSAITSERKSIVKFSESLYTDEAAILCAPSRQPYYKDIFAHLKHLDHITYLAIIASTLSVAMVLAIAIDMYLKLNVGTIVLMVYSIMMVLFWIDINKVIGAYLVTNQAEDVIKSLEDIVDNKNIIPSANKGGIFHYYFNNKDDPIESQIWSRMVDHNNQGIIATHEMSGAAFIDDIRAKRRVLISVMSGVVLNVIKFCQTDPKLNLFISTN